MKSYEALELAIGKKAPEFAKRLRLSTPLIHKWTEPSTDYTDSGALNPLDRVEMIIETSLALRTNSEDALAPIHYLAKRFDGVFIAVPQVCSLEALTQSLLSVINEFGRLTQSASVAMKDGEISKKELKCVEAKGQDVIRQVTAFIYKVKESAK